MKMISNATFVPLILFWTTYFYKPYDIPTDPYNLSHCVVTNNRSYLEQAHVLLFHWHGLDINDLPATRDPSQLWVLVNHESPPHSRPLSFIYNSSLHNTIEFNLTATYRTDSDLSLPYGKMIPRLSPLSNDEIIQMERLANLKFSTNKTLAPIAWVVSNCNTESKREKYVEELTKLIPVDIYGWCGKLTCGKVAKDKECYEMLEQKYFFYLSFENSCCNDYVTEKAFTVLSYNLVPIVFGGANYSRFLPAHSYIDATSLTPFQLAFQLKSILDNPKQYLEYLQWKRHYQVSSWCKHESQPFDEFLTALCDEIHSHVKWAPSEAGFKPIHNETSKTLEQIVDWYTKGQCFEPDVTKWSDNSSDPLIFSSNLSITNFTF